MSSVGVRPVRTSRAGHRALLVCASFVLAMIGVLWPQNAWAADDRIDSWNIDYVVNADGTVDATENLVYRFGSTSGRHGIQRFLTVRESWDDKQDAVYDISNITVSSTNASAKFTTMDDDQGRDAFLVIRVGDANRVITSATASYTIRYRIGGALRSSSDYAEFYWDALSGETKQVSQAKVTVTAAGGVQQANCYAGPAQSTTPCTSAKVTNGIATYTQDGKPATWLFTVGAKLDKSKVANATPHLVTRADAAEQLIKLGGLGAGALSLVLAPLAGLAYWRRHGRDLRFQGLPPGVLPAPGQPATAKPSGPVEVPVAFAPPRISVAEAGLLVDGVIDTTETTATLVDLAVRGAIKLGSEPGSAYAKLINPALATAPHEQVLLQRLFGSTDEVDLSQRGSMLYAHQGLVLSVRNQVARQGWFTDLPSSAKTGCGFSGIVGIPFLAFAMMGSSTAWLWLLLPLVPIIVTAVVVRSRMSRGQRSGVGRAYTDQVEGFRTYIETAEADQLRFEEGEDIFSKYLPWAIVFGLAERWADLCAQLVRMGRLSAEPPAWYYGPYSNWNFYVWNDALSTINHSAAPPVQEMPSFGGSSGSGWGGGSSFGGGGGFSGGGGGGGGIDSW